MNCSNQSPSRAPRAATRGDFAAARAACVSTWLGEFYEEVGPCHQCQEKEASHHTEEDPLLPNGTFPDVNSQDPITNDGSFQPRVKCISCKRKVYKNEFIRCSGKCGKEFHGECVLSEDEKNKFFVIKSDDPWHCAECASFLQGSIKWGNMVGSDEISQQLDSM